MKRVLLRVTGDFWATVAVGWSNEISYSPPENVPKWLARAPGLILPLLNPKQIPKEVADIFNAPSDDEEFVGFRDDVPMETVSSEESCDSFDSLESGKQVRMIPSK